MRSRLLVVLAGLSAAGAMGQGVADAYTLVELPGLSGAIMSSASALNNTGMVVGTSDDGANATAVYWDAAGSPTAFTLAPWTTSRGIDINDEGSALVTVWDQAQTAQKIVLAHDGVHLSLPSPANTNVYLVGDSISARGEVAGAGFWQDPKDPEYGMFVAVRWARTPGGMETTLHSGNDTESFITPHMTDSGLVVVGGTDGGGADAHFFDPRTGLRGYGGLGDYVEVFDVTDTKAYLSVEYSGSSGAPGKPFVHELGGAIRYLQAINCDDPDTGCNWYYYDLDITDHLPIRPAALNDAKTVVGDADVVLLDANGQAYDKQAKRAAFVWSAERGTLRLSDLIVDGSDMGWHLTAATDINELGWIVGNGEKDGQDRAFLLVPSDFCAGDVNRDGEVSPTDFTAWINAFNSGCD
ncbi:MAG: hypothetical protein ED559_00305 [Phycisphaera sp.]|nr:MAG: hypothetical protein ED559_00305 [Phycisphaera sp.]